MDELGQEHTGFAETNGGNANAWIPSKHEAGKKAGSSVFLLKSYCLNIIECRWMLFQKSIET